MRWNHASGCCCFVGIFAVGSLCAAADSPLDKNAEDITKIRIPANAEERASSPPLGHWQFGRSYFVDSIRVGERWFFRPNQIADERLYDAEGNLHGVWRRFHENGRVSTEEPYRHGVRDGTFRYWDPNGTLLAESVLRNGTGILWEYKHAFRRECFRLIPYVDGQIHGVVESRDDSRVIYSEYVRDTLDGWGLVYDRNGVLQASTWGLVHEYGISRCYDPQGNVIADSVLYWLKDNYYDDKPVSKAEYLRAAEANPALLIGLENDGRNVKLQPPVAKVDGESSQTRPEPTRTAPGTAVAIDNKSPTVATPSAPVGVAPLSGESAAAPPLAIIPKEPQQIDATRRANALRQYWLAAAILATAALGLIVWRFRKSPIA